MCFLFTRTLKTEYTKSSIFANVCVPVHIAEQINTYLLNYTAGGIVMARYSKQKSRVNRDEHSAFVPMLKTVEQMALISGIGENKLRQLMADGELEFIQNGNRRLISDQAIWDYYNRAKTPAKAVGGY